MSSSPNLNAFAARLRKSIASMQPAMPVSISQRAGALDLTQTNGRFEVLALELFELQFEHNPAYRRFCEARAASPRSITDWSQIPAIPASAFKDLELSCLPAEERKWVFHSSGTSGHRPSRHYHSEASLALYEDLLWPWFARHFLPPPAADATEPARGEAWLLLLSPTPEAAPNSSLACMFATVRRHGFQSSSTFLGQVAKDGSWTLNLRRAEQVLQETAAEGRPVYLLGTAFSFVHLLDFLGEQELPVKLPPGSRVMETGGYKGRSRSLPREELHAAIADGLGIPPAAILREYGMSELSSQAYDRRLAELPASPGCFHFPPWVRAKCIDPESGDEVRPDEKGLLRVFDLANVYSVMAIQTEDLAVRRGSGFELLGRAAQAEVRGCSLLAEELNR